MAVPTITELIGATAAVVVPVAGLAVAYMKLFVSNSVRGLKLDLIKELNGIYVRRGECTLARGNLMARVERLENVKDNA